MTLLLKIRPQKVSSMLTTPTLKPARHSLREPNLPFFRCELLSGALNDKLGHVLCVSRRMLALFDIAVGYAGLRTAGASTLHNASSTQRPVETLHLTREHGKCITEKYLCQGVRRLATQLFEAALKAAFALKLQETRFPEATHNFQQLRCPTFG